MRLALGHVVDAIFTRLTGAPCVVFMRGNLTVCGAARGARWTEQQGVQFRADLGLLRHCLEAHGVGEVLGQVRALVTLAQLVEYLAVDAREAVALVRCGGAQGRWSKHRHSSSPWASLASCLPSRPHSA